MARRTLRHPGADNHEAGAAASFTLEWRGTVWQTGLQAGPGLSIPVLA